jgi:hypothetical protein
MEQAHINLTTPIVTSDATLWFSAYGFGWGYRAFELSPEVICDCLGAANESTKQLLLAFQLGRPRLLEAAERTAAAPTGERVALSAEDLQSE